MAARDDPVVVEIGSGGLRIHGSRESPPSPALVAAAVDWIDDPVGLLEGRPVPTATIWRALFAAAAGGRCPSLVIVHPGDWPQPRIRRVLVAAQEVAGQAVVVARECWAADTVRPRRGRLPASSRSVIGCLAVVIALVAAGGAAVGGGWVGAGSPRYPPSVVSLVEVRVGVLIPSDWTVERRTTGPGSPRVRVASPDDPRTALNITWSHAPGISLAETNRMLRTAATAEPDGVFDFAATAGGSRPAVSYRETRPGRVVRWTVFIDGSTRIAVGCQSAPGRLATVLAPCLQAVRSAREVAF
ncbi:MAG: type VII secretion-associated protein [Mycobacterium sp.]|nr:type VII secretion-associated protein [Mycobacterium sp.]